MSRIPADVLVRCDGSSTIGMGHVVRCLALAVELRGRGLAVAFAVKEGPPATGEIERRGFPVVPGPEAADLEEPGAPAWIRRRLAETGARALVLDARDGLTRSVVASIRDGGVFVVDIDDPEDKRLEANLAVCPPVPQALALDPADFHGELLVGPEWILLRPELLAAAERRTPPAKPRVLVTMGGADPFGLTARAVRALSDLDPAVPVDVVLGPAFSGEAALETALRAARRAFDVIRAPADPLAVFGRAAIALACFGTTSYELALLGVPAVYVALTEDHAESASAFVEAGAALCLGLHDRVEDGAMLEAVRELLAAPERSPRMAEAGRKLVDGKGAAHVADRVAAALARQGEAAQ